MKTAVLLITFNRLDYVKETLKAISVARPPRIYLASDGPRPHKVGEDKIVQEVRDYMLSHINWPCEIHTRFLDINSGGCKYGVSEAVSWFFNNEPEGIILEDDCVADPTFFTFCEELLEKYRENKKIWHIAGDAPIETDISASYYFAKIQHCWGWASWADRWQYFSLDVSNYGEKEIQKFSKTPIVQEYWRGILTDLKNNLIDTWDYQWTLHILANDGMCINPAHNLISNIGEQGVHYSGKNSELVKKTYSISKIKHPKKIKLNQTLVDRIYSEKFNIRIQSIDYYGKLFGFIPLYHWRKLS
ncbi:MAG: nucleotide-diphospho-sugar transferase [Alphaproteobacteria bacterium]|nr:nucleotide-diphospho-sugar transferase [Alphaproteobacteria bacterium]